MSSITRVSSFENLSASSHLQAPNSPSAKNSITSNINGPHHFSKIELESSRPDKTYNSSSSGNTQKRTSQVFAYTATNFAATAFIAHKLSEIPFLASRPALTIGISFVASSIGLFALNLLIQPIETKTPVNEASLPTNSSRKPNQQLEDCQKSRDIDETKLPSFPQVQKADESSKLITEDDYVEVTKNDLNPL